MRVLIAAILLVAAGARAADRPPSLVLLDPALPGAEAGELSSLLRAAPELSLAAPERERPVLEAVLPLYKQMEFRRAAHRLADLERAQLAGHLPTPARVHRLVEIELWLGAMMVVSHDPGAARERFLLARAIDPHAKPDRLLPPEVAEQFAASRPPPPVAVAVALPDRARLWIDGRASGSPVSIAPGLHWFVSQRDAERAESRLVAIPRSGRVTVAAGAAASASEAADLAGEAALLGMLPDGGTGLSRALERPLWWIARRDGALAADRWSAGAAQSVSADAPPALVAAMCQTDGGCVQRPPSRDQAEESSRARAHFEAGSGLYHLGNYTGALREFAAAWDLTRRPGFLFNIAQSYRMLNDLPHAREMCLRFLDEAPPDDPNRERIEEALLEVEQRIKESPPPAPAAPEAAAPVFAPVPEVVVAPPPAAPPPRAPPARRYGLGAPIAVGVIALAAAAVGAGLLGSVAASLDGLEGCRPGCDPALLDGLPTRANAGYAMLGVAAAGAVIDAILWAARSRRAAPHIDARR